MHLDFANLLNLVSTITLIGALVFTGLQVRAANRARREQAAVTVIETAALSENSARFLELLSEIPEGASAAVIENFWWMFKPLTISPVAPSSVSGRAQKAGRKKGESARATMNFWNGANGWPHKSRTIAPRGLMFLLTRGPELATGRVPTGLAL